MRTITATIVGFLICLSCFGADRPQPVMVHADGALANHTNSFWSANSSNNVVGINAAPIPVTNINVQIVWNGLTNRFVQGSNITISVTSSNITISGTSSGGTGDFKADGSVPMTGDFNAGRNNLINVLNISSESSTGDGLTITANGNTVTVADALGVTGDLIVQGKITSFGGVDPTYLDLTSNTLVSATASINSEVTHTNGNADLFFNTPSTQMVFYVSSIGKYFAFDAHEIAGPNASDVAAATVTAKAKRAAMKAKFVRRKTNAPTINSQPDSQTPSN